MKQISLLFLLLMLAPMLLDVTICSADVVRKGILFYDDCEDAPNLTTDWLTNGVSGQNTLATSSEQAFLGQKSYKVVLAPYNTPGTNSNSELVLRGLAAPAATPLRNFKYGQEYWISYALFVPNDFINPDILSWGIHGQFHSAPDTCDIGITNPMVSMGWQDLGGGAVRLSSWIQAITIECWYSGGPRARTKEYPSQTLVKGGWNTIVMNFRFDWQTASGPFFKIWLNGDLFTNDTGINCFNDVKGPYFKWGLYDNSPTWTIIYMDEFRVGDETSDYASVAPGGSSQTPPPAPSGLIVK